VAVNHRPVRLAVITSQAFSLHNFRGPLLRALVDRGVDVLALAPDFDDDSRAAVAAFGAQPVDYSLSRAGLNPVRDVSDALALTRQLKRLKPDRTFSYFIKPVIYGTFAAALAGVPRRFALVPGLGYVFTMDGDHPPPHRRVLRRVVARMYGAAFARCERVIFQNDDDITWFTSRGLIPRTKAVRTSGTGIDLTSWNPVPLPSSPPVFLLVARLLVEKGILDFVEAARRIKARYPESRFLLVGGLDPNPGALTTKELKAWVREGVIEWPGHVADVRPWIAQASVFVLPSYREGIPRSTQEALAMGRPVITTDTVGCRETVIHGVNGFLVPVRSPAALADAMERFIRNPAILDPMGRASRLLAEQRFDVRNINAIILGALGL
jgi:glycosyltransferase involved in cell wall biosynthesis